MERIGIDPLDALLRHLLVTEEGIDIVHEIRGGQPLEPKPRIRTGKIRGVYASHFMGCSIRLNDSLLQTALLYELDDPLSKCVEYYSWAKDIGGIRYSVSHGTRTQVDVFRPFLFEITENRCGFVDAFPTSMLKRSVDSGSALYEEVADGYWTSPPLAERLSPYGLRYQILTESHFGKWYLLNMGLLSSYRPPEYKVRDPEACTTVAMMVKHKGYMFRRELLDRQMICADDLNYLIVTGQVFFPLKIQDLMDMRSSAVFRDRVAYDVFKANKEANEGFLSLDTRGGASSTSGAPSTEPDFLQFVSREAYAYAQHKLSTLSERVSYWWPGSGPGREGKLIAPATKAVWKSQAELGELLYDSAAYGLIPRWQERGSRAKKFPESDKLWDLVYIKHRLMKRWTIRATHGMFTAIAKRLRLPFFSERTAKVRDQECDRSVFVKFRDGSAARYAIAGFAPPGTANPLYQVTVPLFLAHIDHTPLSIKIENSANGRRIKAQVWLTVMIDTATGRKLAWTISFSAPSAAAVATVLFECIRKHGCLPRFIVVDNAPEFDSLVMHRILQEAESHLLWRPAYHPRYGAPVEAANNKISVQTLQLLAGNTVAVKTLYDFSRTFIARNPELMTLTQLNAYLTGIFDEVELEVGSSRTGDESVKEYEARKDFEVGIRYRKSLKMTRSLRRLCMPPASNNGLRRVRDEGYVVVNNLAFFSEDLKRFQGKSVRVFPDLIHPGFVYVYVGKDVGWCDAKSIYSDFFALYSMRELHGVLAELMSGPLRGVRDPAVISTALAEKLVELERDPKRKDLLALQMDRLMNRAQSLLETEPDSHRYFNPPPITGAIETANVSAITTPSAADEKACNVQTDSSIEVAAAAQTDQKADGSALRPNVEATVAATEKTGAGSTDAPKDKDVENVVRRTRLSF